jgi:hypothetical protein
MCNAQNTSLGRIYPAIAGTPQPIKILAIIATGMDPIQSSHHHVE